MAKWQIDAMLDAGLAYISSNSTAEWVCSGQPANYAGIDAMALASAVPVFEANTDGDVSGRKLPVSGLVDIPVFATDSATHIVLSSADTLLYVTTCTPQELTIGNTVVIPTWDIEIADVTP